MKRRPTGIGFPQKDDPAAWIRRYRELRPEVRERGRMQRQAYGAAARELRELHRDEFDRLYREALEELRGAEPS